MRVDVALGKLLSLFFFAIAIVYFARLRAFGDPTGADGYFYLKQIQSLADSATFYYRDYSLAFAPPVILDLVFKNPLMSYQLATMLVFGGIGGMAVRLVRRIVFQAGAQNRIWARVFLGYALIFFAFANLPLELSLVFLKTATGVFFLLLAWDGVLTVKWGRAGVAAVAAILAHKIMLVLVPLAALLLWLRKGRKDRSHGSWQIILAALGIVLAFGGALWLQPGLFGHFRELLGRFDFSPFSADVFATLPTAAIFSGLLLPWAALALLLARRIGEKSRFGGRFLGFCGGLGLLAALLPTGLNSESAKYRLVLVAAPFFPIVLGIALHYGGRFRIAAAALAMVPLLTGLFFNRPLASWVNPWSARMTGTERLVDVLPAGAFIYAPHGAEFYLAYRTPFRPRSLRIDPGSREVYRIAYVAPYVRGGVTGVLQEDLKTTALLLLGTEFYLYREADWIALNTKHLFIPHPMNLLPKKPDFVADYD